MKLCSRCRVELPTERRDCYCLDCRRAYYHKWQQTDRGREAIARYRTSDKCREVKRRYENSEKGRDARRRQGRNVGARGPRQRRPETIHSESGAWAYDWAEELEMDL